MLCELVFIVLTMAPGASSADPEVPTVSAELTVRSGDCDAMKAAKRTMFIRSSSEIDAILSEVREAPAP